MLKSINIFEAKKGGRHFSEEGGETNKGGTFKEGGGRRALETMPPKLCYPPQVKKKTEVPPQNPEKVC